METSMECISCKKITQSVLGRRYPKIVCSNCLEKVVDKNGNKVEFENEDYWGGCISKHHVNDKIIEDHDSVCYIDNIKCYASEARFGGIVIVPC